MIEMASIGRNKPALKRNRGGGAPTKCSAELIDRYCQAVQAGLNRRMAAAACGLDPRTVQLWIQRAESGHGAPFAVFLRRLREVEAERVRTLYGLVLDAAIGAPATPAEVDDDGRVVKPGRPARRPEWRAALALADRIDTADGTGFTGAAMVGASRGRAPVSALATFDGDGDDEGTPTTADVIDSADLDTSDEGAVVRARLARLRHRLQGAELAGNQAAVASLSLQVARTEDRLLALRAEGGGGGGDGGGGDASRMAEGAFLAELAARAAEMPDQHLRVFVDVYLTRHRALVADGALVADPSQVRHIGGSDDDDDPDAEEPVIRWTPGGTP